MERALRPYSHPVDVGLGGYGPLFAARPARCALRETRKVLAWRQNLLFQTAQLSIVIGCLSACAAPRGAASPSLAGGPCTGRDPLIVSDTVDSATREARPEPGVGAAQQPALVAYLRTVAAALLAPSADTNTVLAAAGAADVERGSTQAYFRPPDSRLARGIVDVGGPGVRTSAPEFATFYCHSARARVTLADLVAAFGP